MVKVLKKISKTAINYSVLSQAVRTALTNKRSVIAHTKDRGEVRGGGIKPWKQKGTGRARAGSSRSPIWRGGGITFGPRNSDNFSLSMPKKMRIIALKNAFQIKNDDKKIVKVDQIELKEPKTKYMEEYVFEKTGSYNCLVVVSDDTYKRFSKSARNLPSVKMVNIFGVNILDILNYEFIILDSEASMRYLEIPKKDQLKVDEKENND